MKREEEIPRPPIASRYQLTPVLAVADPEIVKRRIKTCFITTVIVGTLLTGFAFFMTFIIFHSASLNDSSPHNFTTIVLLSSLFGGSYLVVFIGATLAAVPTVPAARRKRIVLAWTFPALLVLAGIVGSITYSFV